jgi:pyruvate carboxylase subunit B
MEVGWAAGGDGPMNYIATTEGQVFGISLVEPGVVTIDGAAYTVDLQSIDGGFHYSLLAGTKSYEVFVERCEDVCFVTIEGHRYQIQVEDERVQRSGDRARAMPTEPTQEEILSPMPGLVVAVLVEEGQVVRTGEGMLILEAMKMENEIRAPRNGVVSRVNVLPGQRVSKDDLLARIGTPEG